MTERLTSKDVCKHTGCTHRQLQYWELKGYLKPELGSRNVRFYDQTALRIIRDIILKKKSGKSLGEAYVLTENSSLPTLPLGIPTDTLEQIQQLQQQWFEKNDDLMNCLRQIFKLESSIPTYPYSVYNETELDKLKAFQTTATKIKQQKDDIYRQLQAELSGTTRPDMLVVSPAPDLPRTDPATTHHYSIDQLVLMWIRKYGLTNTLEIREKIHRRLRAGETVDQIVLELA